MTWQDLYASLLSTMQDPIGASYFGSEELATSWGELVLNFIYLRSKSQFITITGRPDFALTNIYSKVGDVSLIKSVRKSTGERIDRLGYNILTAFDTIFSQAGPVTQYYTIGATIFGVFPIQNDEIDLTYIPYIPVNTINDFIPLRDEFRPALNALLNSLMLARLGFFDRAEARFQEGILEVSNVLKRAIH